ncbi:hypothetical protein [Hyalangium versicolor]|uniref:hypothetical protein n=1 Tax=Hyalangium versicolor TaxID=2861190 RepID=UPI001CCB0913|nr:hypothetical protein [Hyalangium versicolor]
MSTRQHMQPLSAAPQNSRAAGPGLRVIRGEGQRRPDEPLTSRDAVARVLMEAGADLLLRRISPARAEEIERQVDRALELFDRVEANPLVLPVLRRHLDALDALMRETRERRPSRRGG